MDKEELAKMLKQSTEENLKAVDESTKSIIEPTQKQVAELIKANEELKTRVAEMEKRTVAPENFNLNVKFPNKITVAGKQFDLRKQGNKLLSKVEKSKNKYDYSFMNDDGEAMYNFKKWALLFIKSQMEYKNSDVVNEYKQFLIDTKADMVEGSTATGGDIVPTEYASDVILLARDATAIMDRVSTVPMAAFVKKLPKELTRLTPYFVDEMNAPTESTKTWQQLTLTAEKLGILTESVSNELIADAVSGYDIVSDIFEDASNKMGLQMEYEVLRGTTAPWGAAMGIMTSKISTNALELSSGSPTNSFSGLTDVEFSLAIEQLADVYSNNAVFVAGKLVRHYLKTLKDTNGQNIYIGPNSAGGVPEVYGTPFLKSSQAVNTSAASTILAVVGDLSQVLIGARDLSMNLRSDPYTDFAKDGVRFAMFMRFGLQIKNEDAFCTIATTA